MAQQNIGAELDLEKILRTLASLPSVPPVPQQDQTEAGRPSPDVNQSHSSTPTATSHIQAPPQDPRLTNRLVPSQRPVTSRPHSGAGPVIDSSAITEWKHGLRCVSKAAAQNSDFILTIQKLIKDQIHNVHNWERGRQSIIRDQTAKRESEKVARAAISLPGLLDNAPLLRTPAREEEELRQFDEKVYRAQEQMIISQTAELRRLGVPFFGTRPDLVLVSDAEAMKESEGKAGKITKKRLSILQKKMLQHLLDLYGE
ncbi:hypothetical protein EJ04DRAFT_471375 [Polyplosphaeria fusca]|uniref:Uncharacterized protein n=1 Tax=Polyplosphaeria fusca TaxID=682080 RepID=A0A9P4QVP5_9PLEO|nr:hypothetical protein EJ04DRAFT_471375 [Polyplosphaeria fusca]